MNCPNCGTSLPEGTQTCPVCGVPMQNARGQAGYARQGGGFAQGFDPTAYGAAGPQNYGQPPYAQGGGQQRGFDPTAGNAGGYAQGYDGYPSGYQQVYGRYSAAPVHGSEFLGAMSNLPRVIRGVIGDPGEALRGMMERNDRYTGAVVAGLSLLMTFLVAILMSRSALAAAFSGLSGLTGVSLAGDAASLNQGVNYIAGKMAMSVGGIAALCQLIALVFPAAVALTYLCAVKKVRFSFLLASNFVAIVTLPTIAASILCMVFSLLSPVLGALMVALGTVASYVLLSELLVWVTGMPRYQTVPTKIAVIGTAETLKVIMIWLVGGALANAAVHAVTTLIGSMGSLL
jgi:hypothetical protein